MTGRVQDVLRIATERCERCAFPSVNVPAQSVVQVKFERAQITSVDQGLILADEVVGAKLGLILDHLETFIKGAADAGQDSERATFEEWKLVVAYAKARIQFTRDRLLQERMLKDMLNSERTPRGRKQAGGEL